MLKCGLKKPETAILRARTIESERGLFSKFWSFYNKMFKQKLSGKICSNNNFKG